MHAPRLLAVAVMALAVLLAGCPQDDPPQSRSSDDGTAKPAPREAPVDAEPGERVGVRPAGWGENWPAFRGPGGDGVAAASADPPADLGDLAAITKFKVPVPAKGHSSPIVWGDRVFLTGEGDRVMAFDAATGELLWNKAVDAPEPLAEDEGHAMIDDTGLAAPTAVCDGQRVYAFFGTGVMGAFTLDGEPVWADRPVEEPKRNSFGLAASPVLFDGLVIQVVDLGTDEETSGSFIVALKAADGAEAWRTDRPVRSSWQTPLLVRAGERWELVTAAAPWAIAYNPANGEERWRAEEIEGDAAASPVAAGESVYVASYDSGPILAIRTGGKGNVTETHVRWSENIEPPIAGSLLTDGKRLFHTTGEPQLKCNALADGKELWGVDLPGDCWASPVLAAGRVYLLTRDGQLLAVSAENGAILSQLKFGEKSDATPAVVGRRIYVRTESRLWCLEAPAGAPDEAP